MPLHRDIYWVGRQWAVTGYGMQAIDQRLNGIFDIEVSRLWEDSLAERMHALQWLNAADFDKGLAAARRHYPDPDRRTAPSEESVSHLKEEEESVSHLKEESVSHLKDGAAAEPPKPAAETFDMRIEGLAAKFVSPWRIRRQR
jgi:hypothetical protein